MSSWVCELTGAFCWSGLGLADFDYVHSYVSSLPCLSIKYGPTARVKLSGKKNFAIIRFRCLEVKPQSLVQCKYSLFPIFFATIIITCIEFTFKFTKLHFYVISFILVKLNMKNILQVSIWKLRGWSNLSSIKPHLNNNKNVLQILTVISFVWNTCLFCSLDKFLHICLWPNCKVVIFKNHTHKWK